MNQNLFDHFQIDLTQSIGFIFDVDELLFDNRKEITLAYRSLLESRGIAVPKEETFPGKNLFDIIGRLKEVYGLQESIDELVLERRQKYVTLLDQADPSSVAPGVKEFFCFVEANRKRLNIRLGYASSSEKAFVKVILKKIFTACHLSQYAQDPDAFFYRNQAGAYACTCWEQGMEKKPSPRVYLDTIKKIGLPASQCIAFEDSLSGLQAAQTAGLHVVVVPSSSQIDIFSRKQGDLVFSNPYVCINSLADLWPFFSSLASL